MTEWPASWRSLSWFALAGEAVRAAAGWVWRKAVYRHNPTRRYP